MSDFINKLPPGAREALEQQQAPVSKDDFKAMLKNFGLVIPEKALDNIF